MKSLKKRSVGSIGKHQPLHINISFNINPKSIVSNHASSEMKICPSLYQTNAKSMHRKQEKHREGSTEIVSKKSGKRCTQEKPSKELACEDTLDKNLQRIKKNLFTKIEQMDIDLPKQIYVSKLSLVGDHALQGSNSVMTEKMVQHPFSERESENLELQKSDKLLNKIQNLESLRSKVLNKDGSASIGKIKNKNKNKIYPKGNEKWSNAFYSHDKHSSNGSHDFKEISAQNSMKSYPNHQSSTIEIKDLGKKNKKIKQVNLNSKLQKFKVDIIKLLGYYEDNDAIKTKMTSEVIFSESSEKYMFASNEQFLEDLDLLGSRRENPQDKSQVKTPQTHREQFVMAQQMYEKMRQSELKEDENCTQNLIKTYTHFVQTKNLVPSALQDDIDIFRFHAAEDEEEEDEDKDDDEDEDQGGRILSTQLNENLEEEDNPVATDLNQLMQYVEKSIKDGEGKEKQSVLKNIYDSLLKLTQKTQKTEPSIERDTAMKAIDYKLNEKYEKIMKQQKMKGEEAAKWTRSKKDEIIVAKKQLWCEYDKVKSIIEQKVLCEELNHQIMAPKARKRGIIMKSLSQKIFRQASSAKSHFRLQTEQEINLLNKQKDEQVYQLFQIIDRQISEGSSDHHSSKDKNPFSPENIEADLKQFQASKQTYPSPEKIRNKSSENSEEDSPIYAITDEEINKSSKKSQNTQLKCETEEGKLIQSFNLLVNTVECQIPISSEEKEDIYEFIFLDLCIELYQEAIEEQSSRPRTGSNVFSPAVRIINKISQCIKHSNFLKPKRKVGIVTNLAMVRQYLSKIRDFIYADFNDSQKQKRKWVLDRLTCSIGPSEKEILKSMRISVTQNPNEKEKLNEELQVQGQMLVLLPSFFTKFEAEAIQIHNIKFDRFYDCQEKQNQRVSFLRNCTHIHNKAIFDCLNQSLDFQRDYGVWGRPFHWKHRASFPHHLTEDNMMMKLQRSFDKVVFHASYVCGIHIDKQDSLVKNIVGQKEYILQIQQDRIFKMLQNYIFELQTRWFFYDDEETEIMMELAHVVWTWLISEVAKDLLRFIN